MTEILNKKHTRPQTRTAKEAHKKELESLHDFYRVKTTSGGEFRGLEFIKAKILKLLKKLNYYRFDVNRETHLSVRIVDNKINEVSPEYIKDDLKRYIDSLESIAYNDNIVINSNTIYDKWIDWHENIKPVFLNRLDAVSKNQLKTDTRKEKYLYFKNCVIKITADKIKTLSYKDVDGFIWEDNIIQRNYKQDNTEGDYQKFAFNVSGKDPKRFNALRTQIGFLIHQYFERELFAILFTDSEIGDYGEANGRTGKGLICDGIGHTINANFSESKMYVEIDGKIIKKKDKFAYADCNLSTQTVHINDIYRSAKLEEFYNIILKGIDIDKKGQDSYKKITKIVFTTNMTIDISGSSDRARVRIFEFAEYYTDKFTPATEFKKWFFTDWDAKDWNQFYTFMIDSAQLFLKYDVITPPTITLERRTLIEHTNKYFVDFMDDFMSIGYVKKEAQEVYDNEIKFAYDTKIDKKSLFDIFILNFDSFFTKNRKPSMHIFTKWIRKYGESKPDIMPFSNKEKYQTEGSSNGHYWIIFKKVGKSTKHKVPSTETGDTSIKIEETSKN